MNLHYAAVIADLTAQRKRISESMETLSRQLSTLDTLISDIRTMARIAGDTSSQDVSPDTYTDMSMRWATLYMLTEHTTKPLTTAEISSRMIAGGFIERPNFTNKVSAIVSQGVSKGELAKTDAGYEISDSGKEIWKNIKSGEKFLNRHQSGAVVADSE